MNSEPRWTIVLPVHTVSEANVASHQHYRKRHARAKQQRGDTVLFLRSHLGPTPPPLPLRVRLTRIAPRALDDDSVPTSMKSIRDGIADYLGLKSDRNPDLRFEYGQERGKVRSYAVRVEIWPL